jgi:hypothetical protein
MTGGPGAAPGTVPAPDRLVEDAMPDNRTTSVRTVVGARPAPEGDPAPRSSS